jgi:DNA-binding XRE family transcriptional regulator
MNQRLILLRALAHKTGNLAQLRDAQPPKQGWISAVRRALGMTAKQLAERVGLSQPRIAKMELNENNLKISIRQVLFCKFMHKKQIFPFPSRLSKFFLPSIPRVVPSVASR